MNSPSLPDTTSGIRQPKDTVGAAKAHNLDRLCRIPLFQTIMAGDLSLLSGFLHEASYPAGTVLIWAEQPGERAYIVLAGTVKVQVEQADGSNVILAILGPGQLIGEMSLADSLDCSASVVTLEESHFLWIDRDDFQSCLRTIPGLQHNVIQLLSARLRLANTQIQALAALDTAGRITHHILAFAKEYGQQAGATVVIPLRLTQDDLADLIGCSRGHVNRVLTEYKQRGFLSIDRRHYITIHNLEELARRRK